MTDRTNSLVVALDGEYRVDDAEVIADAISMIKGVLKVSCDITNREEWAVKEQAKREIREKIWELLK